MRVTLIPTGRALVTIAVDARGLDATEAALVRSRLTARMGHVSEPYDDGGAIFECGPFRAADRAQLARVAAECVAEWD